MYWQEFDMQALFEKTHIYGWWSLFSSGDLRMAARFCGGFQSITARCAVYNDRGFYDVGPEFGISSYLVQKETPECMGKERAVWAGEYFNRVIPNPQAFFELNDRDAGARFWDGERDLMLDLCRDRWDLVSDVMKQMCRKIYQISPGLISDTDPVHYLEKQFAAVVLNPHQDMRDEVSRSHLVPQPVLAFG